MMQATEQHQILIKIKANKRCSVACRFVIILNNRRIKPIFLFLWNSCSQNVKENNEVGRNIFFLTKYDV